MVAGAYRIGIVESGWDVMPDRIADIAPAKDPTLSRQYAACFRGDPKGSGATSQDPKRMQPEDLASGVVGNRRSWQAEGLATGRVGNQRGWQPEGWGPKGLATPKGPRVHGPMGPWAQGL